MNAASASAGVFVVDPMTQPFAMYCREALIGTFFGNFCTDKAVKRFGGLLFNGSRATGKTTIIEILKWLANLTPESDANLKGESGFQNPPKEESCGWHVDECSLERVFALLEPNAEKKMDRVKKYLSCATGTTDCTAKGLTVTQTKEGLFIVLGGQSGFIEVIDTVCSRTEKKEYSKDD